LSLPLPVGVRPCVARVQTYSDHKQRARIVHGRADAAVYQDLEMVDMGGAYNSGLSR